MWSSKCQYLGRPLKTRVPVFPKHRYLHTRLHDIISQMTVISCMVTELNKIYQSSPLCNTRSHHSPIHNLTIQLIWLFLNISWISLWYSCSCIPRGFLKILHRILISLTKTTCSVHHNILDTSAIHNIR
jgi:hypothetical protein